MSIQSLSFYQLDQNYWNQSQSFYQQDQNYWSQQQAQSQASSADASLINAMGAAQTNLSKGLASIANSEALDRVNSQISSLVQSVLNGSSGSSASTSSSSAAPSSASSSTSASSAPTPATGTGTVPVTTATSLAVLGILPGGTLSVSDGTNTTTYTSTGTDTIGDFLDAVNAQLSNNADVSASLNPYGQLVFTANNTTDSVMIGGSGNDAAAIGFGTGNTTFQPTAGSSSASASSGTSASSSSSGSSAGASGSSSSTSSSSTSSGSSSSSNKSSSVVPNFLALEEQEGSTAASILTADGVSGSLVNLLA